MKSIRITLLLMSALLIFQNCAQPPRKSVTTAQEPGISPAPVLEKKTEIDQLARAQEFERQGKFLEAALAYTRLANNTTPPRTQELQILAVKSLLHGNFTAQANQLLNDINVNGLEISYFDRKLLLAAEIELRRQKPADALTMLNQIPQSQLGIDLQIYALRIKAQAYQEMGRTLESVRSRLSMLPYIQDPESIKETQLAILDSLLRLPLQEQENLRKLAASDPLVSWVELTEITRSFQSQFQTNQKLQTWRTRYPRNAVMEEVITALINREKSLVLAPRQVALLLPLESKFAKAAQAVRDGFLAAYYAQQNTTTRPIIRVYDTGSSSDDSSPLILDVYSKAVQDGAEFVVGPLNRNSVQTLANTRELQVPTLAFNYVDTEGQAINGFYQFGLSPEDEARQVAERARLDGLERAAVLVPKNHWGERVLKAFTDRWKQIGGMVVESQFYIANDNDFSIPIQDLLNINDSETRLKTLKNLIGLDPQFTPRRRRDVDFIFLAAFPRQARLIRPQLRFHHAANIPVYSTSHVFTGKIAKQMDRDMDGIYFGDMPWVLPGVSLRKPIKDNILELWPNSSETYMRFYALGLDAYNIIPFINKLSTYRSEFFRGEAGNLHIDDQNRIQRQLIWVNFKQGIPVPLDSQE